MRISINVRKIEGPYGGSRNFADNLERYLRLKGHEVFRDLRPQLDLILLVSSKPSPETTSFTPGDAIRYRTVWPCTLLVQRINSCDEQRAQNGGMNQAYLEVNSFVDYTIFVSEFMRKLYFSLGLSSERPNEVILTGVDSSIFTNEGSVDWQPGQRMRVITHHWSNNVMKGYDIYERFDKMLEQKTFNDSFEFTIVGNVPPGFNYQHSKVIKPVNSIKIAQMLRESHLYLTGARHEPGGNHYVEAMRCGLPVLYLDSGSSGEYCAPFGGLAYNIVDFADKLLEMRDTYPARKEEVKSCSYSDEWMCGCYESSFKHLLTLRDDMDLCKANTLKRFTYNIGTNWQAGKARLKSFIGQLLH